ncbi:hypothetical protein ACKKBF_B00875 [Auxenochlorella protothecoides x Auxenochlorella symbiontica]
MSRYLFGVTARTCLQVPLRSRPCSSRHHRTVTRAMSGDNSKKPEGMATKGFPVGPEIKDSAQDSHNQPGLQKGMKDQPHSTDLPYQPGNDDVLSFRPYKGAEKLKDKVCIVTGGDSGIGRSIAAMFARESAKSVTIVYLEKEQEDAEQTKELIEAEGVEALLIAQDLSTGEEAARSVVQKVVDRFGRVDVLVNNASMQHKLSSIEDTDAEYLESTFKTNVFAMFYLAKHVLPHMARGSTIVNSTSVTAYYGSASLLEYSSTKGAIVAFTRSLSLQLAPKGIRVNAVAPGPIITPLNPATREQDNLDGWYNKIPALGRLGQPSEMGPAYVYLASNDSSYMSGQVLHPNGGTIVNG